MRVIHGDKVSLFELQRRLSKLSMNIFSAQFV